MLRRFGKRASLHLNNLNTYLSVQQSSLASKLEDVMSVIDQALKSNERYAKAYDPRLDQYPESLFRETWFEAFLIDL